MSQSQSAIYPENPQLYNNFRYGALVTNNCDRRSGLMVSALNSGASGPVSSPGRGYYVLFGQDTLLSRCLSPPR